jgi:hypothetical protein
VRTEDPVIGYRVTYRDTNSGDPATIISLDSSLRHYTIRALEGDNTYIICVETIVHTEAGRRMFQGCETIRVEATSTSSTSWLLYVLICAAAVIIILIFMVGCCMVQKRQTDQLSALRAASVISLHQAMAEAEGGSILSDSTMTSSASRLKTAVIPVDRKLEKKLPPQLRSSNFVDQRTLLMASTESLASRSLSRSRENLSRSRDNLNRSRENLYSRSGSRENLSSRSSSMQRLYARKPNQPAEMEDIPSEEIFDLVDDNSNSRGYKKVPKGVQKSLAQKRNVYT